MAVGGGLDKKPVCVVHPGVCGAVTLVPTTEPGYASAGRPERTNTSCNINSSLCTVRVRGFLLPGPPLLAHHLGGVVPAIRPAILRSPAALRILSQIFANISSCACWLLKCLRSILPARQTQMFERVGPIQPPPDSSKHDAQHLQLDHMSLYLTPNSVQHGTVGGAAGWMQARIEH